MNLSQELQVAKGLARSIGEIQLKGFRNKIKIIRKSPKELVTNIDMQCQEFSSKTLEQEFDYGIMSEENRIRKEIRSDVFWVLDPIDGTHNYISGLPQFGVSICLASSNEFLLGVIYLPYFDELYHAVKGEGSFMNEESIRVSDNNILEKSMITYDNQFHLSKKSFSNYIKIYPKTFTTRILGSSVYDMGLISSGRIDARIWNKTKPFDFAAGTIIVKEAGGSVTDFRGKAITLDSEEIIASNGLVHNEIIALISKP